MPKRQHPGIEYDWWYEHNRAHHKVFYALKNGTLVRPSNCQGCGQPDKPNPSRWNQSDLNAHHADYSKPLEVQWLCCPCHQEEHLRMKEEGLTAYNYYHLQDHKDPDSMPVRPAV